MTLLTRQQIAEIVGNDIRKIKAFETLQKGVENLTAQTATNVGATTALQDATVITLSNNDTFTNERVLAVDPNFLTITDTGPNGNVILGLLYHIIVNGSYTLTFNTLSDTSLNLPPIGTLVESQLGGNVYASDAAAAAGGVAIGEIYKKTGGTVAWRQV